ncbi:MAG: GNAT family N-acetyltransferase [Burkholderiales bacterium]|nr:GNAT family N-acetyltransferase [Burkholderiales bacterium]
MTATNSLPMPDNMVWKTMNELNRQYSAGSETTRRYVKGFAPFIAFADLAYPDLTPLEALSEAGELLYCDGWSGAVPDGWQLESESLLLNMLWHLPAPLTEATTDDFPVLTAQHHAAVSELVRQSPAGPFGLGNLQLGRHIGIVEQGQLIAMAGMRNCAGNWREICSVVTHPAYRGKGLARQLVAAQIRYAMQGGHGVFLRVLDDNLAARRLYRHMGFCEATTSVARTISRR